MTKSGDDTLGRFHLTAIGLQDYAQAGTLGVYLFYSVSDHVIKWSVDRADKRDHITLHFAFERGDAAVEFFLYVNVVGNCRRCGTITDSSAIGLWPPEQLFLSAPREVTRQPGRRPSHLTAKSTRSSARLFLDFSSGDLRDRGRSPDATG
jgi:hypothetical protein